MLGPAYLHRGVKAIEGFLQSFAVDTVAPSCTLDRLRDSFASQNMPLDNQAEKLGMKESVEIWKETPEMMSETPTSPAVSFGRAAAQRCISSTVRVRHQTRTARPCSGAGSRRPHPHYLLFSYIILQLS